MFFVTKPLNKLGHQVVRSKKKMTAVKHKVWLWSWGLMNVPLKCYTTV